MNIFKNISIFIIINKMDQLCYVKPKHSLKHLKLERQLLTIIDERVKELPDHNKLRLNTELIKYVCNLVENAVFEPKKEKKKHTKINKKDLVIRTLNNIFDYADAEKTLIDERIEFLWNNGDIKKIPFIKKWLTIAWEWIKKKLL